MDERHLEQAAAIEQAARDDALSQIQRTQARQGQPYCEDCDEPIPDQRRAAQPSAMRCIACQGAFEYHQKGTAR